MFCIQGCYDALEDKLFTETKIISIFAGLSTACAVKKTFFFILVIRNKNIERFIIKTMPLYLHQCKRISLN